VVFDSKRDGVAAAYVVSRQIDHGFNPGDLRDYRKADSIWVVASIIEAEEELAMKVTVLDHSQALEVA
jgi:hypothetical protein